MQHSLIIREPEHGWAGSSILAVAANLALRKDDAATREVKPVARIGTIGDVHPADMERLLKAIEASISTGWVARPSAVATKSVSPRLNATREPSADHATAPRRTGAVTGRTTPPNLPVSLQAQDVP